MKYPLLLSSRFLLCIFFAGLIFYGLIKKQNTLTELRLAIPVLKKQVRLIEQENTRLQYQIDCFESPIHLMELAGKPEFSHLKLPYVEDIMTIHNNEDSNDRR